MRFMKQIIYFFIAAAMAVGFGCGIKGPPLPPIETIEDRVNNAPLTNAEPPSGSKTNATSSDSTTAIPPK
jgi:predicted small lipoprotein YifL